MIRYVTASKNQDYFGIGHLEKRITVSIGATFDQKHNK